MQRELDALLRAMQGDGAKRARMAGLSQELIYALQMHAMRVTEADHELITRLQRAIDDVSPPEPQYHPPYQNGQYGPYGHG